MAILSEGVVGRIRAVGGNNIVFTVSYDFARPVTDPARGSRMEVEVEY
jgi:hypothetical protein